MTKRECALRNVKGVSGPCFNCQLWGECGEYNHKGSSWSHCYAFSSQWLKDNPGEIVIPELKPVRCEVWYPLKRLGEEKDIVGKIGPLFLDTTGELWENAEPIKEKKSPIIRPMNKWEFAKWRADNYFNWCRRNKDNATIMMLGVLLSSHKYDIVEYAENTGKEPKESDWKPLPMVEDNS